MQTIALVTVIVLGLVFGSFLNVCIYRIPNSESIVFGRSHCMSCGKQINSIDLIPILSFILLKGKCRNCGAKISPRYPIIEALNAALWAASLCVFGLSAKAVICMVFFSCLIVVSFIDIDTSTIPFAVDVLILLTGIAACFFDSSITILDRLLGVAAGGLPLLAIMIGTRLWFSRKRRLRDEAASESDVDDIHNGETIKDEVAADEVSIKDTETDSDETEDDEDDIPSSGMGGGDVELMAAAGLLLGWKLTLFSLFAGFIIGAIISIILIITANKKGRSAIQFGPFLAIGMVAAVFFGNSLVNLYISSFIR